MRQEKVDLDSVELALGNHLFSDNLLRYRPDFDDNFNVLFLDFQVLKFLMSKSISL